MNIAELIKEIKYKSDWNSTEIANYLGCSQVSISRIRRGQQFPSAPLLFKFVKLAKKFSIKIDAEDLLLSKE